MTPQIFSPIFQTYCREKAKCSACIVFGRKSTYREAYADPKLFFQIGILNALARSSLRTYDSRMPLTQQRFIMPGYTDVVVEMDVEPLMGMTWGCAVEALSDAFDGLLYKYERNQPAEYLWRVQRAGVNMGAISIHKAPVGSLPVEGNGTISSSRLVLNGNESAGADGIALGGKEKRDIISCRAGLKLRNGIADNVKSPVDNSLQVGNNSTDLDDIGNIKVELTFRGEPMGPNSLMFVMNAAILRFAQEDAMTVISMGEVFRRYGSHVHIFGVPLAGPQFGAEWTYLSMTLGFVDMMDTVFKANKLESFGWSLINKGVLVAGGVAREQKDLG